ncbi:MAG: hypothetical protein ABFC88_12355 [Thermoguttaceae bacterium]
MKLKMQALVGWLTGICALALVACTAVSALTYAVMHRSQTLQNLASSALTGVGMAIGGCLGSALILRFKVARRYVKNLVQEVSDKGVKQTIAEEVNRRNTL